MWRKNRPAYLADKIALERARREALRTHAKGCRCPFCMTHADFQALVKAALARNGPAGEEVPF